ncbi:polysaccharide deacetylase family protein [candidate division KSB1 bacterium]|nr:polysaccharide deacetylase family protein [candidate division KSB1 bacterium]
MTNLRQLAKQAISRYYVASGATTLKEKILNRQRNQAFRIFAYHRITKVISAPNPFSQSMNVSPTDFQQQIDFLTQRFSILSLKEIAGRIEQQKPISPKTVAITFDDGYLDIFTNAFPILRERNLPAMIFLATDYISTNRMFWWDELEARIEGIDFSDVRKWASHYFSVKVSHSKNHFYHNLVNRLSTMAANQFEHFWEHFREEFPDILLDIYSHLSWKHIRLMKRNNIHFGSHTKSHAILTRTPKNNWAEELAGSKQILETNLRTKVDWLAYPRGSYHDVGKEAVIAAKKAGYKWGVMNESGVNHPRSDRFRLRRIPVYGHESFDTFLCRCYGLL